MSSFIFMYMSVLVFITTYSMVPLESHICLKSEVNVNKFIPMYKTILNQYAVDNSIRMHLLDHHHQ